MGNEIQVSSWEECEKHIEDIQNRLKPNSSPLLFRGQINAEWTLKTTLERRTSNIRSVSSYYRLIRRVKPAIETFTNFDWELPSHQEVEKWAKEYDHDWEHSREIPGYSYLAHLRHHGFPSPLLDWSRSQYVAAYFAFANASKERVALYVFSETPNNFKTFGSDEPQITTLGPYVRTHQRHFRQQSSYTICRTFQDGFWRFTPHQRVIDLANSQQDILYKIMIPVTERTKVLTYLDKLNLNSYSLFNSEESLMEMLAFREIDLKSREI